MGYVMRERLIRNLIRRRWGAWGTSGWFIGRRNEENIEGEWEVNVDQASPGG